MRHKVLQTIQRYQMVQKGDHVVVAFSGGADSSALLTLLWQLQKELSITVSACHLNHHLRGEESNRDEAFVRQFCTEHHIELSVREIDAQRLAKEQGKSVEALSREERYRFFEETAQEFGISTKIATAHNLNDNAETLLFYLARGTGLNGLGAIPPVRGNIIRPLIECSREEIENFCDEQNILFVTDSTNLTDLYTRNRIRHRIMPEMQQLNPAFLKSILHLSVTAQAENQLLDQMCSEEYQRIALHDRMHAVDRKEFLKLHPAMQRRILLHMMTELSQEPDFCKVREMQQRALQGSGKTELCYGTALCADEKSIWIDTAVFYPNQRQPYFEQPFAEGETVLFSGKSVWVNFYSAEEYKLFFKKDPSILKNAIDCDKMKNIAVFRQRKDGDRIAVYNKQGSKPLKKMWNEAKTPQEKRWRSVVISDSEGVVWVEGFGVSKRAMPDENSKMIALIEIKEDNR